MTPRPSTTPTLHALIPGPSTIGQGTYSVFPCNNTGPGASVARRSLPAIAPTYPTPPLSPVTMSRHHIITQCDLASLYPRVPSPWLTAHLSPTPNPNPPPYSPRTQCPQLHLEQAPQLAGGVGLRPLFHPRWPTLRQFTCQKPPPT